VEVVEILAFEYPEKALHGGIVVAVPFGAHTADTAKMLT
jgi:hypothetical protein